MDNKINKIYLVLCVIVMSAFCVGCVNADTVYGNIAPIHTSTTNQGTGTMNKQQEEIELLEGSEEVNMRADSIGEEYSIKTVITRVHTMDDFRGFSIIPVGDIFISSRAPRRLDHVSSMLPFEFIESIDNDLLYIAYKMYGEGIHYYKYLFFVWGGDVGNVDPYDYGSWVLHGRTFTISQISKYADFENITVGSTISEVAEIEPLAMMRKPLSYIGHVL